MLKVIIKTEGVDEAEELYPEDDEYRSFMASLINMYMDHGWVGMRIESDEDNLHSAYHFTRRGVRAVTIKTLVES